MSQRKSKYDQEFKDNAARYCLEKAPSITQGAKDLQINKCSIFRWVNEYKERTGLNQEEERKKEYKKRRQESELAKQVKELTKKNLELEEQVAILKKVIGMFSQHPQ